MNRITALFFGIAALTVIATVAEAADGCGRGWYYNGRRCVPQDERGYRPEYRRGYEDRGRWGYATARSHRGRPGRMHMLSASSRHSGASA